MGPRSPYEGAIIRGKNMPKDTAVSCAKMAEPIDLLFGLWTRVGSNLHKFSCIRHVALICPFSIELSVCGGYAALCQITCSFSCAFMYQ